MGEDVIAITGAGAVTPLGAPPELWRQLRAERADGQAREIRLDGLPEAVRARALRAERVTQLVLAAGGAALAAAGLEAVDGPPRPRLGVVLGTAFGCFLTNAAYERRLLEGGPAAASPRLFAATVSNAAAGELAIAYRLGGPSVTLSSGGASGLMALGHAADLVWSGHADALVAGGADALGDALRAWIADGGVACRSSPSEGAALLVLEPAAGARRRGVPVLGTIAGFAGGFEPGRTGEGLAGAIGRALAEAEVQPSEVALVVAPEDVATLDRKRRPPRIAPGERLGETFGASGPLGLLAALAEAPCGAAVLVADTCPTGYVAALVARAGELA